MNDRPSVLLIAYRCDATDVSESWAAHRWARGLAERVDLTVLTTHLAGRPSPASQLPGVRVIEWAEGARPKPETMVRLVVTSWDTKKPAVRMRC